MDGKALLASKTTWGTIISFVALIAQSAGLDIGDQEGLVELLAGLCGAALALYGRVRAVKQIDRVL